MMRGRRTAGHGTVLLAVLGLAIGSLGAPARAAAAGPSFGTPTADATYGETIDFSVEVTAPAPLARAELRLRFPGAIGPYIVDVPVGTGGTLRYRLDLSGSGHLVPNTRISYTWAGFAVAGEPPVLSATRSILYADTSQDWQTLAGDIVTVHWYAGSRAFAQKALRIGEDAVRQTADLLGVTETEPIDFFIYGDTASFRTALGPGTRENVGGQAHADIRTLFALIEPSSIDDPWVGIVIPHELVHLVFDTAVENPYRFPPRWVNEGLAVYLSEGYGGSDRSLVAGAVQGRSLIPLTALTGQFPTDPGKTSLAYAEAVSAIDHLVRTHGQDALLALIGAYRDGLTDDEAFARAIAQDVAAFQADWLAGLGAQPPTRYGPASAPPGPLPSGWDGPAPTSAPPGTGTPDAGAGTAGPAAGTPPPAAQATPGDVTDGAGSASAPSVPLLAGGLAAVAAVVVVGLLLARRRREPE